jgi:hypothetical protein
MDGAHTGRGTGPAISPGLATAFAGLAGYITIHSIPGTGAVRSLFLLLLLGGLSVHAWRARPALKWPPLDLSAISLLLLTAWLAFQSGFLAVDGPATLKTFAAEWPKNLLLAAVGIWLARTALFARQGAWLFAALFCGFFAHVLGNVGYQAWRYVTNGDQGPAMSLFGNYGHVSPFVDGVVAIAFADLAGRICFKRRLLPISSATLGGVFLLSAISLVLLTSKASWLNVVLMLGLFAAAIVFQGHRYRTQILAMSLAAVIGLGALGFLAQSRWDNALESIRYGQAIESSTIWRGAEGTLPPNINESFYLRAAWATVAWRGLAEHPLGRGYGSDAFGRYLAERHGLKGAVSSHSGWLDFALANGIPGLLLLLVFGAALSFRSWRAFATNTGVGGLALALLTIGYLSRCLIDGHFTTSRLMGFFLVSGVLWGLARDADPRRESDPA